MPARASRVVPAASSTATSGDVTAEAIAEAAADWIVRLSADDPGERDEARAGFTAWKQADPRHTAVAARMERFIEQARSLGAAGPALDTGPDEAPASRRAARAALDSALDATARRRSGRRVAGVLALTVALVLPSVAALYVRPPAQWGADLRTATGEQRSEVLADGTRLTLGTASALNYRLSPDLRHVELLSGEVLVEVAKDATRPFVVETGDGRIRALGTRFIVRREAGSTLLTMLESKTAVRAGAAGAGETRVEAGQQARLSAQGVQMLAPIPAGLTEEAFRHQRLLVQDRPLPEVLDELARHRGGFLHYDRAGLASIRVSAVLPLDDTDRALQLLSSNFPQLKVRQVTRWVVMVESVR